MPTAAIRRVPYQIPGSPSWQWVSIYTRLSQERIIFLNQPITTSLANSLVAAMLYLDSEDSGKPIYLYINSLGDPVEAGMANESMGLMSINATLAIYDTMQHIKSEVATICLGQAMGTAALLLAAGTPGKRACLPHASIALYQPRIGTQGQATDIQVNAKEALQKKALLLEILSNKTGQTTDRIRKDIDRMFYMTPEEAQQYGIIDRVIPA